MKPSRLAHTEGVVKTGEWLAKKYGSDPQKTRIAAICHDIARNLSTEKLDRYVEEYRLGQEFLGRPNLSHGKVATVLMRRDFGIDDEEILDAVSYHTTGRQGMTTLDKVVFLADVIEPGRTQPGVEIIRELAEEDLDLACLRAIEDTIEYLEEQGSYLDEDTLMAREFLRKSIEKR